MNKAPGAQPGQHGQCEVPRAPCYCLARQRPRDLIIRVAGYRDYFCDLSKDLQEEIIQRTEHERF